MIAGPHQTPFICETEAFGLGPAVDRDCRVKTRVEYFYRSRGAAPAPAATATATGAAALAAVDAAPPRANQGAANNPFKPFDPAGPRPADIAATTTSDGVTVPYIVSRDGYHQSRRLCDRVLHEHGTPLPDPWTTSPAGTAAGVQLWRGCRAGYPQGRFDRRLDGHRSYLEDSQLGDYAVARGYALAAARFTVFGTSCADVDLRRNDDDDQGALHRRFGVPRYRSGSGRDRADRCRAPDRQNYPACWTALFRPQALRTP